MEERKKIVSTRKKKVIVEETEIRKGEKGQLIKQMKFKGLNEINLFKQN